MLALGLKATLLGSSHRALVAGDEEEPPPGPVTPSLVGTPTFHISPTTSENSPRDISHTSTTGNVLVRVLGRTNSGTTITMAGTWNGVAMTQLCLGQPSPAAASQSFLWGAIIRGGATGANTLAITKNTSAGRYVVRIDDIADLPADFLGATPVVTRAVGAVNSLAASLTPEGAESLMLTWGGVVVMADSAHPIGVAGDWDLDGVMNGDAVPDTSVHSRGAFGSRVGGDAAAQITSTLTASGAQTSTTFTTAIVELLAG